LGTTSAVSSMSSTWLRPGRLAISSHSPDRSMVWSRVGGDLLQVVPGPICHRGMRVISQVLKHIQRHVPASRHRRADLPGRVGGQQQPAVRAEISAHLAVGEARLPADPAGPGFMPDRVTIGPRGRPPCPAPGPSPRKDPAHQRSHLASRLCSCSRACWSICAARTGSTSASAASVDFAGTFSGRSTSANASTSCTRVCSSLRPIPTR